DRPGRRRGGAGSLGAGGAAAGAERGAAIGRMGCQCRGGSMELSRALRCSRSRVRVPGRRRWGDTVALSPALVLAARPGTGAGCVRSEEHTSELQSRENLVCRLLLEKKN